MDQIAHLPGTNWKKAPKEEYTKKHNDFVKKERWIIEGNYGKLMQNRLKRADTVIIHRFNRLGCLYRFLKRHYSTKQVNYPGKLQGASVGKKLNWEMIPFILYESPKNIKRYYEYFKQNPHLKIIEVHSFKEINQLLEKVKQNGT